MRTRCLLFYSIVLFSISTASFASDVRLRLKQLYPELSQEALGHKLAEIKTEFDFYRSFVAFFYDFMRSDPTLRPLQKEFREFTGWCTGDPHPENFGTLLGNSNRATLAVSDFDDAGPCPLYADLLRFLTASLFFDDDASFKDLLEAYSWAFFTDEIPAKIAKLEKKFLDHADKKGWKPRDNEVNAALSHLTRNAQSQEWTATELKTIQETVFFQFQAQLLDSYERRKHAGGSGGLLRVETLVQKAGVIDVVEFKQLIKPGVFPIATTPIPGIANRISTSLIVADAFGASPYLTSSKLFNCEMLVRPRWAGNFILKMEKEIEASDRSLLLLEALVLGRLHRRSFEHSMTREKVSAYFNKIIRSDPKVWKTAAHSLFEKNSSAFSQIND